MAKQYGELTIKDVSSLHSGLMLLMVKPGLFNRYPKNDVRSETVLEQHDNMVSICCATGVDRCFDQHAYNMFTYGLTHFFHYNNVKRKLNIKEWFSCFRQPYHTMIMALNAGFWTTFLYILSGLGVLALIHLWLAIILVSHREKGDTSGKLLMWQLYHAYMPCRFLIQWPLNYFHHHMVEQYGSFNKMFEIYYANQPMKALADYANK